MTTISNSSRLPTRNIEILYRKCEQNKTGRIDRPMGENNNFKENNSLNEALLQFLTAVALLAKTVTKGDFRCGIVLMLYNLEQAYFLRTALTRNRK